MTNLSDALPEDAVKVGMVGPNEKWQTATWSYLVAPGTRTVLNVVRRPDQPACTACGAVEPAGGIRLGTEGGGAEYDWFCKNDDACATRIAAQIKAGTYPDTYREESNP